MNPNSGEWDDGDKVESPPSPMPVHLARQCF